MALLEAQGYSDVAQSTLNDWSRFLGRAGRPWAEDRESGELEAESLAALAGGGEREGERATRRHPSKATVADRSRKNGIEEP